MKLLVAFAFLYLLPLEMFTAWTLGVPLGQTVGMGLPAWAATAAFAGALDLAHTAFLRLAFRTLIDRLRSEGASNLRYRSR